MIGLCLNAMRTTVSGEYKRRFLEMRQYQEDKNALGILVFPINNLMKY